MNLFFPHGNRVLQSPMHALAAEQSDAEAEERAGLRPWRMGAVGCMAAKAPGRARRKGSNGRDGLASCMATTRRKRKPHGQRRVAQCERFNCSCGKQSRSDVIPLLSSGKRRDIDDEISLATVRHPGGGRRWCFVCPAQGWRVRKLYLPAGARHFRSRQAYNLAYETEHLDDRERAWRRVRKCRRQLGSDPDGLGQPVLGVGRTPGVRGGYGDVSSQDQDKPLVMVLHYRSVRLRYGRRDAATGAVGPAAAPAVEWWTDVNPYCGPRRSAGDADAQICWCFSHLAWGCPLPLTCRTDLLDGRL